MPTEMRQPGDQLVTLSRALAPADAERLRADGFAVWAPPDPDRELFYPVRQEEDAINHAHRLAARRETGFTGLVARMQVRAGYLDEVFGPEGVQSSVVEGTEYVLDHEHIDEFNRNLIGPIELIHEFHGDASPGHGTVQWFSRRFRTPIRREVLQVTDFPSLWFLVDVAREAGWLTQGVTTLTDADARDADGPPFHGLGRGAFRWWLTGLIGARSGAALRDPAMTSQRRAELSASAQEALALSADPVAFWREYLAKAADYHVPGEPAGTVPAEARQQIEGMIAKMRSVSAAVSAVDIHWFGERWTAYQSALPAEPAAVPSEEMHTVVERLIALGVNEVVLYHAPATEPCVVMTNAGIVVCHDGSHGQVSRCAELLPRAVEEALAESRRRRDATRGHEP